MNTPKCLLLISLFAAAVGLSGGCTQPSPLYGTWNDNAGSSISFMNDNTFTASIYDSVSGEKIMSSGRYNVLLNALTFTTEDNRTIVTEWDIRGNMLYLDWTLADGSVTHLVLYKTVSL